MVGAAGAVGVDGHAQRARGCTGIAGGIGSSRGQAMGAVRPGPQSCKSRPRCALAAVLPSSVEPSKTLTVLLATAVPVSVSVSSLVMPSPTVPLSGENEVMVGATGGAVIVTARAADAAPVLPAASVAVAVRLCAPFASAAVV